MMSCRPGSHPFWRKYMRNRLGLALLAGWVVLAAGCGKPYVVINESPTPLSQYASISVEANAISFLKSMEGDKRYDNYIGVCKDATDVVTSRTKDWIEKNFKGRSGSRPLRLIAEIEEFRTGSTAA